MAKSAKVLLPDDICPYDSFMIVPDAGTTLIPMKRSITITAKPFRIIAFPHISNIGVIYKSLE